MNNFVYYNPTAIIFGKGTIPQVAERVPAGAKTLLTYGGGSIKRNGVYDQVTAALRDRELLEFGGIEPNPRYETLMKAVDLCRAEKVDFLLAVGGGSVLDGTKFVAAAVPFADGDPWKICSEKAPLESALPLGSVLTLPATGSEMNANSVVSREGTGEKLAFINDLVRPVFSILDPETTYTLPERQTVNGIIDAFVHVMEQYATYPVGTPLQDRQAEAVLLTLIEEGPKALTAPRDYDVRADLMWAATHALNGSLGCGVVQDWGTHMIGHEITALYGLDHAVTLSIVLPAMLRHEKGRKQAKLEQYGRRVWGIESSDIADVAIEKTETFFRSLGVRTRLDEHGIEAGAETKVAERIDRHHGKVGEHQAVGKAEVAEILALARPALA